MMYCSMNLARLVKQVLQLLYGNCSRKHDFRIEVHHRNQPNKIKLMLYKPLVHLYKVPHYMVTRWSTLVSKVDVADMY